MYTRDIRYCLSYIVSASNMPHFKNNLHLNNLYLFISLFVRKTGRTMLNSDNTFDWQNVKYTLKWLMRARHSFSIVEYLIVRLPSYHTGWLTPSCCLLGPNTTPTPMSLVSTTNWKQFVKIRCYENRSALVYIFQSTKCNFNYDNTFS